MVIVNIEVQEEARRNKRHLDLFLMIAESFLVTLEDFLEALGDSDEKSVREVLGAKLRLISVE